MRYFTTLVARDTTSYFQVFFAVDEETADNPVHLEQAALEALEDPYRCITTFQANSVYLAKGWRGFQEVTRDEFDAHGPVPLDFRVNEFDTAPGNNDELQAERPEPSIVTYYKDGRMLITPLLGLSLEQALDQARDLVLHHDPVVSRVVIRGIDTDGQFVCHTVDEPPGELFPVSGEPTGD